MALIFNDPAVKNRYGNCIANGKSLVLSGKIDPAIHFINEWRFK